MKFINSFGNIIKVTDDPEKAASYLENGFVPYHDDVSDDKPVEKKPRKKAVAKNDGE